MKNSIKSLAAIAAVAFATPALADYPAPTLLYDFAAPYTVGALAGQGDWAVVNAGANPISVVGTGLEYTGYETAGGAVALAEEGEDVALTFVPSLELPIAIPSVYYSLMLRHDGTDVGDATGDYIAHFSTVVDGDPRGKLYLGEGSAPGLARVGISYGSNDPVQWSTVDIPANTTAFIAVRLLQVAGPTLPSGTSGNDTASLYIHVAPDPIEIFDPLPVVVATNSAANTDEELNDLNGSIARIDLRQGSTSGGSWTIDEVRVGFTWGHVLPDATAGVADWQDFAK